VDLGQSPTERIRDLADQGLDRLNSTFCELYASEGRPSNPPEQLLGPGVQWYPWDWHALNPDKGKTPVAVRGPSKEANHGRLSLEAITGSPHQSI